MNNVTEPVSVEVTPETSDVTPEVAHLTPAQMLALIEMHKRNKQDAFRRLCFASAYSHTHKAKMKRAGRA